MRQGRGEATGQGPPSIYTAQTCFIPFIYLLIPPVTQKREDCDPTPTPVPREEDLELRDVKHFVPGSQRSCKQKSLSLCNSAILSFPKR